MVPEGWREGQVKDFFFLQRGFDITQREARQGKVPVFSSSGFSYFHDEAKVKGPGVVTGRKGSVGQVYFIEEDFWPHDTTLWVKDFKGNEARYIEYFLNYLRLDRFDEASSVPTLNRNNVHSLKCVFPPAFEQKKIVETLSAWERVIAVSQDLMANSQLQKKALEQQLLTGKRRLPSFSREWKQVRLGDVFAERTETNRLVLPLLSITSDRGVIPQAEVGRKDSSTEDKSKYKRIAPGDIGYNSMRMWQGVSALSELEGIVSPAYTIVTPRKGIDPKFMSYLFKLPRTVHDFRRYSQGLTSDTWNLKFKQFREVTVRVPEFDEQQAIAEVFAMQDEVIAKLEANKAKLELEKRALMQQLLTGKRRIKLPHKHTTPAKEHAS